MHKTGAVIVLEELQALHTASEETGRDVDRALSKRRDRRRRVKTLQAAGEETDREDSQCIQHTG